MWRWCGGVEVCMWVTPQNEFYCMCTWVSNNHTLIISKSANQKVILLVKVSKALFWDTDYVALDQFQKLWGHGNENFLAEITISGSLHHHPDSERVAVCHHVKFWAAVGVTTSVHICDCHKYGPRWQGFCAIWCHLHHLVPSAQYVVFCNSSDVVFFSVQRWCGADVVASECTWERHLKTNFTSCVLESQTTTLS